MINPKPKGADRNPTAEVLCDDCGFRELVRADYERRSSGHYELNEGQVVRKLTSKGWTMIRKTLRCPTCENARRLTDKPKKETTVNNVLTIPATEDLRQPTRDQKRVIIALLGEVYDTKACRYTGGETDKTVAETIGGGVMLGWVAQIREDLFGPDGGNDELIELRAEVSAVIDEAAASAKKSHDDINAALNSLRNYNKLRDKLADALTRIDKLKRAVGPKGDGV